MGSDMAAVAAAAGDAGPPQLVRRRKTARERREQACRAEGRRLLHVAKSLSLVGEHRGQELGTLGHAIQVAIRVALQHLAGRGRPDMVERELAAVGADVGASGVAVLPAVVVTSGVEEGTVLADVVMSGDEGMGQQVQRQAPGEGSSGGVAGADVVKSSEEARGQQRQGQAPGEGAAVAAADQDEDPGEALSMDEQLLWAQFHVDFADKVVQARSLCATLGGEGQSAQAERFVFETAKLAFPELFARARATLGLLGLGERQVAHLEQGTSRQWRPGDF